MKITINLNSVGAMRDLMHFLFDNGDNDNADVLGQAIREQMWLDRVELNKEGATREERLANAIKKESPKCNL